MGTPLSSARRSAPPRKDRRRSAELNGLQTYRSFRVAALFLPLCEPFTRKWEHSGESRAAVEVQLESEDAGTCHLERITALAFHQYNLAYLVLCTYNRILFGLMERAHFNIPTSVSNYFCYSSVQAQLASAPLAYKNSSFPQEFNKRALTTATCKSLGRSFIFRTYKDS